MSEQEFDSCAYVQEQMHFLDDTALANQREGRAVAAHLEHCADCRAEWSDLQDLLGKLKTLDIEPMREAFVEEAFAKVREYREHEAYKDKALSSYTKPLLGLAASVLLVAVVFVFNKPGLHDQPYNDQPYDVVSTTRLSTEKVHDLRIAFNSPGVLENVGIEIILPESVNLKGSQLHKLSWQTNLYKGKNELTLPLESALNNGLAPREEFVLARLTHGDKVKEFRVRLLRSEQA